MAKRSRSEIAHDSRKAVGMAGTRLKRGSSGSAFHWGGPRKISAEDMRVGAVSARPGKSAKRFSR